MGAIAAALDVTAGERERQTLEPLLATPVTVPELIDRQVAGRQRRQPDRGVGVVAWLRAGAAGGAD